MKESSIISVYTKQTKSKQTTSINSFSLPTGFLPLGLFFILLFGWLTSPLSVEDMFVEVFKQREGESRNLLLFVCA